MVREQGPKTRTELLEALGSLLEGDDAASLLITSLKNIGVAEDEAKEQVRMEMNALLLAAVHTSTVTKEHLERIDKLVENLADSRESEVALAERIGSLVDNVSSPAAAGAMGQAVLDEIRSSPPPVEGIDSTSAASETAIKALTSMLEDKPLTTSLFNALLPRIDGLKLADKNKETLKRWLMVASFLAFTFPKWKSRLSYVLLKAMQDSHGASGATALARGLLPGAHPFSTAERLDDKAFLANLLQDATFDTLKYFLVFIYDNIQKKHARTTEAGAGDVSSSSGVQVRTMRIVLCYQNSELAALQRDLDSSPARLCEKYPLAQVSLDAIDVRLDVDVLNPDQMSEQDYLHEELKGAFAAAVERIRESSVTVFDEKRGDDLKQAGGDLAKVKKFQKACIDGCDFMNSNRHRICSQCGAALPNMDVQKSTKLSKTTEAGAGGKTAAVRGPVKEYTRTTHTQRLEQAAYLSPNPSYAQDGYDYSGDADALNSSHSEKEMAAGGVPVTRLILPLLDVNPAAKVNQMDICQGFLDLVGHGKQGGVLTVARCTDAGATDVRAIIRDEVTEFWPLLALGHAEMAITRLAMKIVVAVMGEHFIYAHKFKEGTGGPAYLKSCKSNHKAWTFIQLICEALQLELTKQHFLAENPSLDESTSEELAEQIIGRYDAILSKNDDKLLSNAWIAARFLSACTLFRKALRDNQGYGNAFALDAATKIIVPLMYVTGFTGYAPLLHWNYLRTTYRSSPGVQKMLRNCMCINGQGLEFHIEEDIQRVMRATKGRSGKAMQKAVLGTNAPYRLKAEKILGVDRIRDRKWRSNKDRAADRQAFDDVFRQHNTLSYKPGRAVIESVDGKYQWVSGISLESLCAAGLSTAKANQAAGFKIPVSLATKMLQNEAGELGVDEPMDDFAADAEKEAGESDNEDDEEDDDEEDDDEDNDD